MLQSPRKLSTKVPDRMGYEDFVWFMLSEEDKSTDVSLEYWFRCIDLDCDGVLRSNEMLVSCCLPCAMSCIGISGLCCSACAAGHGGLLPWNIRPVLQCMCSRRWRIVHPSDVGCSLYVDARYSVCQSVFCFLKPQITPC